MKVVYKIADTFSDKWNIKLATKPESIIDEQIAKLLKRLHEDFNLRYKRYFAVKEKNNSVFLILHNYLTSSKVSESEYDSDPDIDEAAKGINTIINVFRALGTVSPGELSAIEIFKELVTVSQYMDDNFRDFVKNTIINKMTLISDENGRRKYAVDFDRAVTDISSPVFLYKIQLSKLLRVESVIGDKGLEDELTEEAEIGSRLSRKRGPLDHAAKKKFLDSLDAKKLGIDRNLLGRLLQDSDIKETMHTFINSVNSNKSRKDLPKIKQKIQEYKEKDLGSRFKNFFGGMSEEKFQKEIKTHEPESVEKSVGRIKLEDRLKREQDERDAQIAEQAKVEKALRLKREEDKKREVEDMWDALFENQKVTEPQKESKKHEDVKVDEDLEDSWNTLFKGHKLSSLTLDWLLKRS